MLRRSGCKAGQRACTFAGEQGLDQVHIDLLYLGDRAILAPVARVLELPAEDVRRESGQESSRHDDGQPGENACDDLVPQFRYSSVYTATAVIVKS